MTDVRSLLRQQQAARRITHKLAIYTDSGKLACLLCDELVKTESLWDTHIRSKGHRLRVQTQTMEAERPESRGQKRSAPILTPTQNSPDAEMEEPASKKRNLSVPLDGDEGKDARVYASTSQINASKDPRLGSSVPRRLSGAPSAGMEIQIPSRPATPSRSTIQSATSGSSDMALPTPNADSVSVSAAEKRPTTTDAGAIDEDEWAAFEADIAATTTAYSADATISAPAMTAEEVATAAEQSAKEGHKEPTMKQIEEEKEDAKRLLESEFEEMEELEAKVRQLKEKREALRKQVGNTAARVQAGQVGPEKDISADANTNNPDGGDDDGSDDDESDSEDDWAGFRFKGTIN
ncbi:hypothetical protein Cpir12675_006052 [Ceratocystis pirilliformis]|uniref:Zinc finger double-stranded RNA binding domain-containing protein n=1 Tax=Ceratocystis pirilliformis TaxID=259994 RepID=A0ABR3YL48_9PEZI